MTHRTHWPVVITIAIAFFTIVSCRHADNDDPPDTADTMTGMPVTSDQAITMETDSGIPDTNTDRDTAAQTLWQSSDMDSQTESVDSSRIDTGASTDPQSTDEHPTVVDTFSGVNDTSDTDNGIPSDTESGTAKDTDTASVLFSDTVTDTFSIDSMTDSTTDTRPADTETAPQCRLSAACVGDVCEGPAGCCDNTICGAVLFADTDIYKENYCYQICDSNTPQPCECGYECVQFTETQDVCAAKGELVLQSLTLPVGETKDAHYPIVAQANSISVTLGETSIPLERVYAYWKTFTNSFTGELLTRLVIDAHGFESDGTVWLLSIWIPEDIFNAGVGRTDLDTVVTNGDYIFADLISGTTNSDGMFTEYWRETVLGRNENADFLDIGAQCTPCAENADSCNTCQFSMHATFYAVRRKTFESN